MQTMSKFQLRLPQDIKEWLRDEARKSDRTMNSQVIAILRQRLNAQTPDRTVKVEEKK